MRFRRGRAGLRVCLRRYPTGGSAFARGIFNEQSKRARGVRLAGAFAGTGAWLRAGVMRARANYMAEREGIYGSRLRAFGPHGQGLVIANAPNEGYDDALSRRLTEKTVEANLAIRKLGYKPYIAPDFLRLPSRCCARRARLARRGGSRGERVLRLPHEMHEKRNGDSTRAARSGAGFANHRKL
jgi:hypothetical protein